VDDEVVPILARLKNLRWLDIKETKLTPQGVDKLRRDGLEMLF
jgi:hypothetical protein